MVSSSKVFCTDEKHSEEWYMQNVEKLIFDTNFVYGVDCRGTMKVK